MIRQRFCKKFINYKQIIIADLFDPSHISVGKNL